MSKSRIQLKLAASIAKELVDILRPHCIRIEVAGSIRRKKSLVGDVEIVLIPCPGFYEFTDQLDKAGTIAKAEYGRNDLNRWGKKYRGMMYRGIQFDVFIVDHWNFGYQYYLRTGPGDANTYIATRLRSNGAKIKTDAGYVYDLNGNKLFVPNEDAWWNLLGIRAVAPENRSVITYRDAFKWHEWKYPPRIIRLSTHQLGKHAPEDVLDITIKGKSAGASSPEGQLFAPTWDMLNAYKAGNVTWDEYREQYLKLIRDRYMEEPYPFEKLLRQPDIKLGCYCPAGEPCHRLIAVYIISGIAAALGAEVRYGGEVEPVRKIEQLALF